MLNQRWLMGGERGDVPPGKIRSARREKRHLLAI